MENLKFKGEISIPQAKALFNRGTYLTDSLFLLDQVDGNYLPQNTKKTKCLVIIICEKGKIRFDADGETIKAEENDAVILYAGQVTGHYKVLTPTYRGKAILVNLDCIGMLAEDFCNTKDLRQKLKTYNIIKLRKQERINSSISFDQTINFINNYEKSYALAINQIKIILQSILAKKEAPQKQEQGIAGIFEKFVDKVDENVMQNLHVSDYCNLLEVSSTTLANATITYAGKTPLRYIQEKLINRICIIAESTSRKDMPISKIAEYAHFSNTNAFRKFVKRMIHMSLATYLHKGSAERQRIIHRTTLDQIAALKDLPRTYILEDLVPLLFG